MIEIPIHKYLDSLPSNIKEIDISYRKLTALPDLSRFTQLRLLVCRNNYITELPILPSSIKMIDCYGNKITKILRFHKGLKKIDCGNNKLLYLPELNEELTELYCGINLLTNLPKLNKKLQVLSCYRNKLTQLPELNSELQVLHCYHNKLTQIPQLNEELCDLDCSNNCLIHLPELNEKLEQLYSHNNEQLHYLLNIRVYQLTSQQREFINRVYKCRYRIMCLKYKKIFWDWLWKRVREPNIQRQYHPDELLKRLKLVNHDDIDLIIDEW